MVENGTTVEEEGQRLDNYPDDCAVCGEALDHRHPDDPPVHPGCEDEFFGDYA